MLSTTTTTMTTDDEAMRAAAEAQIAAALRDLQVRLNPAPANAPAVPENVARLFAQAADAEATAQALLDEAERLSGLLARTRVAAARSEEELAAIAEARQQRAVALADAQREERGLEVALQRAGDDKEALARIGGDLARADAQLASLHQQLTAASERRAELERTGRAAADRETKREVALIRAVQQHQVAIAGYQRDEAAARRQAAEATERQGAALVAAYQAHLVEVTARQEQAQLEALAARGHATFLRRAAREQLAAWVKADAAVARFVEELTHADAPSDPTDVLLDALDVWLRALETAAGRVPAYREFLEAATIPAPLLASVLQGRDVAALRSRHDQVQHMREAVARARVGA